MNLSKERIAQAAIAFVEQAAVEAGVGTIFLELTIEDVSDTDPQALRLFADLAKTGARLIRKGTSMTVRVSDAEASSLKTACLNNDKIANCQTGELSERSI